MPWAPKINAFDERPVKDNLLAYFQANQSDALLWANNGIALPDVAKFYKSPRPVTVFPCLTIIHTEHTSENLSDTLSTNFVLLMELAVIHGNMDELNARSSRYALAFESMLWNMPETTLCENSILDQSNAVIGAVNTTFDVMGKTKKNSFIQVFQIRAGWQITSFAFN